MRKKLYFDFFMTFFHYHGLIIKYMQYKYEHIFYSFFPMGKNKIIC